LRCFQEGDEEGVFAFSQRHWLAVSAQQASTASLEPPSAKRESSTLRLARSCLSAELMPAQNCAHARE
jgi:hypothetical protein